MEWMAYDSLSPIGGERGDIQAAIVANTVAAFLGSKDSQFSAMDSFPWREKSEEEKLEFKPVSKEEAREFLKQVKADGNS